MWSVVGVGSATSGGAGVKDPSEDGARQISARRGPTPRSRTLTDSRYGYDPSTAVPHHRLLTKLRTRRGKRSTQPRAQPGRHELVHRARCSSCPGAGRMARSTAQAGAPTPLTDDDRRHRMASNAQTAATALPLTPRSKRDLGLAASKPRLSKTHHCSLYRDSSALAAAARSLPTTTTTAH